MSNAAKDNIVTLAALGALAYGLSMFTHEALGHGGVCALAGGHTVMLSGWGERCSIQPAGIEAAGPLTQFGTGLLAWLLLRVVPESVVALRTWLLFFMAYCLFVSSGYVLMSGFTGFGDAAVVIANLSPQTWWRAGLVIGGSAIYYASMWACGYELRRLFGSDENRLLRIVWPAYLAAGVMAGVGGYLNQTLPSHLGLELGLLSSFGGAFGLLRLPDLQKLLKRVTPGNTAPLGWNFLAIAMGLAGAAAFILLLGKGVMA